MPSLADRLLATLRDVPDFPAPGILFKDITPVLANPALMREVIARMADPWIGAGVTHVVGVESRGFLFGMPLALALGAAFAPARKPGKLPWRAAAESYALEYRTDTLEMHEDALGGSPSASETGAASRVLIVDDVLATGGTAAAACRLVERLGGVVLAVSVLVEIGFLEGRARLPGHVVDAVVTV